MNIVYRPMVFLICCIFFSCLAFSQDNLRTELFGEANQTLAKAKERKADLYAPTSYDKAMRYYNQASEDFGQGRKLEDIREKIKNAELYFAKALDACKLGEETFSTTMAARTDAASAEASKSTAETWSKAEEKFRRAARDLEDGNLGDAKQEGNDATALYRSAELEAIKSNYLSPARSLVKKAEEMNVKDRAPKTLSRAQELITQVETLLNQNRYDTDSARQLAQEAKYEGAHALYLSEALSKMKREDKTYEDVILSDENQLQRVAARVGVRARFDTGFDAPVADIISAINAKDSSTGKLEEKVLQAADSLHQATVTMNEKDGQIENLKLQIASMERRLGSLTETEKNLKQAGEELQQKLYDQHQQEQKIRGLSSMFSENEANVLRDGDNIIIRLYGLTFPVGKNTIESQYFALLTKVQEAIKKFPRCTVTIEGHTDSQGRDDVNQALSESRAKAVAEYLMANMGVELPIHSQGYGESRPIASNDTPEGKAKNRRIDVVITPANEGK